MIGRRIAHYEIQRRIGEGGMGEVWVARDLRLGRAVALKRVRTERVDERMRKRLWREARSAASVNHPNVCQVYDVVEENDELFLAMELLDGESLEQRMARGPLPVRDAIAVLREILRALAAVHDAGLVHRDLKPGNVVLTAHGVKLLDFGLSRSQATGFTGTQTAITREGQAVGTPRYMSPEQWAGDGVGPPADLFAAGAMFYEMMSGQPAIVGSTIREVMEDAVSGRPPVLHGDPDMTRMSRVIRRSMARPVVDRYSSARSMLEDLEEALHDAAETIEHAGPAVEDHYARVAVLPFRMLRPDPEIDFLASSLPEAIIASLSSMGSVVVCSAPSSAQGSGTHDIAEIARRTSCNAVLSGTILRAGSQVRVTSQLLQVPEGNVIRAQTSQGALDDIFRLQDDIANDIVRSLPIDREGMDRRGRARRRPSNGKAYELYLRANQIATQRRRLPEAAALYRECLDLDPAWAPAWAMMGRVYRVLAKFSQENAEENFEHAQQAFRRAFELDPDLSDAHNLYTALEVEELGRSREAMVRLLERAKKRATEPQLFVGLVLTCRFCGLMDASLAADRRARHLDPGVRTSVHYTYFLLGDWAHAI
ncbi:MAG TPA: protein kinase, partial [bacterium]|nr:protein kinase [bacterium]